MGARTNAGSSMGERTRDSTGPNAIRHSAPTTNSATIHQVE